MARASKQSAEQLPLALEATMDLEPIIEARIAARAEADAFRWRLRLILVETLMMGLLVLALGLVLHRPFGALVRIALGVAGACFASGILLIGLSGATAWLLGRAVRWWRA